MHFRRGFGAGSRRCRTPESVAALVTFLRGGSGRDPAPASSEDVAGLWADGSAPGMPEQPVWIRRAGRACVVARAVATPRHLTRRGSWRSATDALHLRASLCLRSGPKDSRPCPSVGTCEHVSRPSPSVLLRSASSCGALGGRRSWVRLHPLGCRGPTDLRDVRRSVRPFLPWNRRRVPKDLARFQVPSLLRPFRSLAVAAGPAGRSEQAVRTEVRPTPSVPGEASGSGAWSVSAEAVRSPCVRVHRFTRVSFQVRARGPVPGRGTRRCRGRLFVRSQGLRTDRGPPPHHPKAARGPGPRRGSGHDDRCAHLRGSAPKHPLFLAIFWKRTFRRSPCFRLRVFRVERVRDDILCAGAAGASSLLPARRQVSCEARAPGRRAGLRVETVDAIGLCSGEAVAKPPVGVRRPTSRVTGRASGRTAGTAGKGRVRRPGRRPTSDQATRPPARRRGEPQTADRRLFARIRLSIHTC